MIKHIKRNITHNTIIIPIALLIGILLGFMMAFYNFNTEYLQLKNEVDLYILNLETYEVQLNYLSSSHFFCDPNKIKIFSNELEGLRLSLVSLEEQHKINDIEYKLLKDSYNINQIKYLNVINQFNAQCNNNDHNNTIDYSIYFFNSSNTEHNAQFEQYLSKYEDATNHYIFTLDYKGVESLSSFYLIYNYTSPFIVENNSILTLKDIN